jgi:hypothetical protein
MAQDDGSTGGRGPGALFEETFGAVGCAMVLLVLFAFYMLTLVITGFVTALRPWSLIALAAPLIVFFGWRAYRRWRRG